MGTAQFPSFEKLFGFGNGKVFYANVLFDISGTCQREAFSILFDREQQLISQLTKMCLSFVQLVSPRFGHASQLFILLGDVQDDCSFVFLFRGFR